MNIPHTDNQMTYCKRLTFGDEFFLVPLAFESLRQMKYKAKCALIKVYNQPPNQTNAK